MAPTLDLRDAPTGQSRTHPAARVAPAVQAVAGGKAVWTAELRVEMLHVLGLLFGTGTAILATALLMPLWPGTATGVLAGIVAAGAAGAALFLAAAPMAMPVWVPVSGLTLGTGLVTLAAWAMGPSGSASAGTFYVFALGYAFFYLPRSWALIETAVAGAGYAVVVAVLGHPTAAAQWTLTIGAAAAAGWVISGMARRSLARQRELADRLAQVDYTRTLFLRTVNHDLRAPLTAISGFAQTLVQQGHDPPPADLRLAQRIVTSAARLERMLDDLLALDRINSGEVRLDRQPTDLVRLVTETVGALTATEVIVHAPPSLTASVDRACIEHAVANLVGNAAKYGPRGAPVDVAIVRRPEGVAIRIDDHGPGIPEATREAIFEPFVRGPSAGRTAGSGVGLSIARQLVRLHGGDVTAGDRPGGGSRFTVTLPDPP